jgi:hypothetical protein
MKKIFFNLLILVLFGNTMAFAQKDSVLIQQLRGKQTYSDIMNVLSAYYKNPETLARLGESAVNRTGT